MRAEHERSDMRLFAEDFLNHRDRIALPDGDRRHDAGLLDERARGLRHHRLGAQPRLFLHRRLDCAPLNEFLLSNERQYFDRTACLGGASGGKAQRYPGGVVIVDDNQIGTHGVIAPPIFPGTVRHLPELRKPTASRHLTL